MRIHRAGEGAPYDGLKPAGHIEPFVAAVDRSLATGSVDSVVDDVTAHVSRSVRERFTRARETAPRADSSVDAGRAYVAAYVDYLHYVEALHSRLVGFSLDRPVRFLVLLGSHVEIAVKPRAWASGRARVLVA